MAIPQPLCLVSMVERQLPQVVRCSTTRKVAKSPQLGAFWVEEVCGVA